MGNSDDGFLSLCPFFARFTQLLLNLQRLLCFCPFCCCAKTKLSTHVWSPMARSSTSPRMYYLPKNVFFFFYFLTTLKWPELVMLHGIVKTSGSLGNRLMRQIAGRALAASTRKRPVSTEQIEECISRLKSRYAPTPNEKSIANF